MDNLRKQSRFLPNGRIATKLCYECGKEVLPYKKSVSNIDGTKHFCDRKDIERYVTSCYILDVPYSANLIVRSRGAVWSRFMHSWYIPHNISIENFEEFKLIPPHYDHLDGNAK